MKSSLVLYLAMTDGEADGALDTGLGECVAEASSASPFAAGPRELLDLLRCGM